MADHPHLTLFSIPELELIDHLLPASYPLCCESSSHDYRNPKEKSRGETEHKTGERNRKKYERNEKP